MEFDFHGLCDVDMGSDGDELIVDQYIEDILGLFHQTEIGMKYGEVYEIEGSWINPFLQYAIRYDVGSLPHMDVSDVRYLLEDIFPEKVTVMPEQAGEIIPELVAFWQFVDQAFEQPDAKAILKYLQKIEAKYPKTMMDERKYGIAKTIAMQMLSEGVDMTDQKAVDAFLRNYNQGGLSGQEAPSMPQSKISLEQKQSEYSPPVSDLLTMGKPEFTQDWSGYLALGFSQEHITDLNHMVVDRELHLDDSGDELYWAPIHAWRVLGQMRSEESVEALISLLGFLDEDDSDWIGEEVPEVFGRIGPSAIPHLKKFLGVGGEKLWGRVAAAHSLEILGKKHYQARFDCIETLTDQLKEFYDNDETLNAFLIFYLLDLKAVEALPVIEEAYQSGLVDLMVCGDWEDVQVEFGLLEKRITPKRHGSSNYFGFSSQSSSTNKSSQEHKKKKNEEKPQKSNQSGDQKTKKKRKRRRKKK